ncbi:Ribosomal protein L28e protein [Raphanus sativus]|nr:Ribosomal protein L28e protein [Raphanus sativus]
MSTKRSSRRLVISIFDAPFSLTGFVSVTSTVTQTLSPPSSTITHLRLFPIGQTRNRFHLSHRLQLQSTLIYLLNSICGTWNHQNKLYVNKSVLNKEAPRMAKAVANQAVDNYYKPDLKKTALARCSVISKGLRVAKSHLKKRNMQA